METKYQNQAIPAGTFFAESDVTSEQYAAMQHVQRVSDYLVDNFADDLSAMARDVQLRYEDIAGDLIPDVLENYPEVAKKAIGRAVRLLIPQDELKGLTHDRRVRVMTNTILLRTPEERELLQRQASLARWEKDENGPDIDAMLSARGRIAWSDSEKQLLREMIDDPDYQYITRYGKTRPDYDLIAQDLNDIFHDGQPIRYNNSVLSMRNMFFKKPKDSQ